MPNYEQLYHLMFNAVTDALALMEGGGDLRVRALLRRAQQEAEALYLAQSE